MERLAHGYTNCTTRLGGVVTKVYDGPDAAGRQDREAAVLRALSGQLPVPRVIGSDAHGLRLSFVGGVHGQDLIDDGRAEQVLAACGRVLRQIHAVRPDCLPAGLVPAAGEVLVHGDFGPNNVLLDAAAAGVLAVVDWEWAHAGDPVEDLAWCEWIVRMHHPSAVGALGSLFCGYGWRPAWAARHRAMLCRHRELIEFCQRWDPSSGRARHWQQRLAVTAGWAG